MNAAVLRGFAALAALLACSHPGPPRTAKAASASSAEMRLPGGVRPLHYRLHLDLTASAAGFGGDEDVEVELSEPSRSIWIHAQGLRVIRAFVTTAEGARLDARLEQVTKHGLAKLELSRSIGPGRGRIHVEWEGPWGEGLIGLYRMEEQGRTYLMTQLEPISARTVFPCFDEPAFKTPYDVSLTVASADVAVSNAPARDETAAGDGRKLVRFETSQPLPTYLVFVASGPFEVVTPPPLPPNEVRSRPLPVRAMAPRGQAAGLAFALEASTALVPWYERYFGIPFPYAKLDHVVVPQSDGGMENAGAISYPASFLLVHPATSDDGRWAALRMLAHEIAHQWFGDLVTPEWWTDVWLNESFATWIAPRAADAFRAEYRAEFQAAMEIEGMKQHDGQSSSRAIRQPIRSLDEIYSQFDPQSYSKGAGLLGMLERWVGPEVFRAAIAGHLRAHAHGTASTRSVLGALDAASGRPVTEVATSFLERPGLPVLSARVACEPGGASVALAQERWMPRGVTAAPQRWRLPVCLRWADAAGEHERCEELDAGERIVRLGPDCPGWLLPNAGAAGYYVWKLDGRELAKLRSAMARLTPVERAAVAFSVRAARRAGALPISEELETLATAARDPDPLVVEASAGALAELRDLLPEGGAAAYERFVAALHRPALRALGLAPREVEAPADRRLRLALLKLLTVSAHDPAVLGDAAALGERLAAARFQTMSDAGLARALAAAAVQSRGAPVFQAIADQLGPSTIDPVRGVVVYALTHHDAAQLAAANAALWRDRRLTPDDRIRLWFEGPPGRAVREGLARALEQDFEGTVALFSDFRRQWIPYGLDPCAGEITGRLRALFEPRLAAHPEMRPGYEESLEVARNCDAERREDGPAAVRWLEAHEGWGGAAGAAGR